MAKRGYDYITNATDPKKVNYLGDFIMAADGSIYGLAVTDNVFAYNFYSTMNNYLDAATAGWKKTSDAGKTFDQAFNKYFRAFDGSNKNNLAYEAAMAEVLNKLNSGVTMVKYDPATSSFQAVIKNIVPKKNANCMVEKDAEGNIKTTAAKRC